MTRYYALVLVPGYADTPEEEACEAAELLYPYMRSEDDPEADHKFDWFLQPDDISEPDDDIQLIWRARDIVERFPELEVEAVLTPDGRWHGSEAEVWDDEAWVARARQILRQHPECLALRHVLHIRDSASSDNFKVVCRVVDSHLTSSLKGLITGI